MTLRLRRLGAGNGSARAVWIGGMAFVDGRPRASGARTSCSRWSVLALVIVSLAVCIVRGWPW